MEIAVMVKPEAMHYSDEALRAFESEAKGELLDSQELILSPRIFDAFYGQYKHHPNDFYQQFKDDLVGKNAMLVVYNGFLKNFKLTKERIRLRLEGRIEQLPDSSNYTRNGIHCSSSRESARLEVEATRRFIEAVRRNR